MEEWNPVAAKLLNKNLSEGNTVTPESNNNYDSESTEKYEIAEQVIDSYNIWTKKLMMNPATRIHLDKKY